MIIHCLQDPTIHHKDLRIDVPVQQCIPDHVYYNKFMIDSLIEIKKLIFFNGNLTIVQTFLMY